MASKFMQLNFQQYGQMNSTGGKNQRREEKRKETNREEKRREEKKEDAGTRKGRNVGKMSCGSGEWKSSLA